MRPPRFYSAPLSFARRRPLRATAIFLSAMAATIGLGLFGLGLYGVLFPGTPYAPGEASELRFNPNDPGPVYDRLVPRESYNQPASDPGTSGPGDGSGSATAPQPTPVPPLPDGYRMVIQKIGVNAPVSAYGLDASAMPEVPLVGWEVAWYNFTAQPGTGSNAVFAGHVTWNGRAVFYQLDQLAPGDQVVLRADSGAQLTYTVSDSFLADKSAVSVMSPTPDDEITIITCGGSFFRTNDPVFGGDYTKRLVVRAKLTAMSGVAGQGQQRAGG